MAGRLAWLLLATAAAWADGPQFATFFGGSVSQFAAGVATDPAGNVYIAGQTGSPDLPVTAGAAQQQFGGDSDVFVAKYSPAGALLWATYYGGSGGDGARGIAVDPAGNVLVAGITTSRDFPVVNPLSSQLDGGHLRYGDDAFVVKLDTTGKVVYATYLGGQCNDWAWAIAADAQGNAYIAGETCSHDFPAPPGVTFSLNQNFQGTFVTKLDPAGALVYTNLLDVGSPRGIAVDSAGAAYITGNGSVKHLPFDQRSGMLAIKLTPDGSAVAYATAIGAGIVGTGGSGSWGLGIAVDAGGSAYITGVTSSANFPLVKPLQSSFGARSVWQSTDDGATWAPFEDTPIGNVRAFVPDPSTPGTLYVATGDGGVLKSTDGGASWAASNNGMPPAILALAIDPNNSSVLFASADGGGLYKSSDGAASWQLLDSSLFATQILVDPNAAGTVYTQGGGVHKSTDGGASWTALPAPSGTFNLALDPNAPGVLYLAQYFFLGPLSGAALGVYRSGDGGASWQKLPSLVSVVPQASIVVDASHNPSIIYAGSSARSDDGGLTWTPLNQPRGNPLRIETVDPLTGNLLAVSGTSGVNVQLWASPDRGITWQPAAGTPVLGPAYVVPGIGLVTPDPHSLGTLYAVLTDVQSSAFVMRLSADGSQILFSTFLHGHPSVDPAQNAAAGILYPPAVSIGTNYGAAIALDPQGNIVIAGATRTVDFPTANAAQPANAGQYDAFATILSPNGDALLYATYFGGGLNDQARGVAVDNQGNLILAGQTNSFDFPSVNAAQTVKGPADTGWVLKIAPRF